MLKAEKAKPFATMAPRGIWLLEAHMVCPRCHIARVTTLVAYLREAKSKPRHVKLNKNWRGGCRCGKEKVVQGATVRNLAVPPEVRQIHDVRVSFVGTRNGPAERLVVADD